MLTGKNYIGNQLSGNGTVIYTTINPIKNEQNSTSFTEASRQEIEEAVSLASVAFETYRSISAKKKALFLNAIADEIIALDTTLISTYCKETGLPEGRALGERARTVGQLRSFAALLEEGSWVQVAIDTGQPHRKPIAKPDIRKMFIPLGPVVVFGASNFPLAYSTAGGDTASALAAGCPVIVKSHPMHAGVGELVASAVIAAAKKTAMPDGVFSNLNSSGIEVGVRLVSHPKVKAVGFTGSIRGGRALYDLAAQRDEPIPVFAEMGSTNPVILMPKALQQRSDELASTYANSITLGSGQFCTKPGLLLGIKGEALSNFSAKLAKNIAKIAPSCMLHPNIAMAYNQHRDIASEQQKTIGLTDTSGTVNPNYGRPSILTVSGEAFLKNKLLQQEVFGPYSLLIACDDYGELLNVVRALEGQLTGTILGEPDELEQYTTLIEVLQNKVGRIIFNGVPTGVEVCPSMMHGGPYPASTDSRFTAVGSNAINRWVRPFSYQGWPNTLLPKALQNENPLQLQRVVNGKLSLEKIEVIA